MSLSRRDFLQMLAAAQLAGMGLDRWAQADTATAQGGLYDAPRFGNVSFLHMTDCHAQLLPMLYREPSVNLGIGAMRGLWPHRVGHAALAAAGVQPGSAQAHALSSIDFEQAARRYGRAGGFAHLSTLVKQLKASRPGALLLDGGDTWQGSATALWTQGQDMVEAAQALSVDVMTGHWEFTYGIERVKAVVAGDFAGKIDFVAQNVKTSDFDDPVFPSHVMREMAGVPVAVIGQAFPYTPIAHPRHLVEGVGFGVREQDMQETVDAARASGARVVVLLSHNGMDVDLKMASRVRGIDAIFGGHTHDAVPLAVPVKNGGGVTLVTNAGSNGKFIGVMDFDVKGGRVRDYRYRLLPVFANQITADPQMEALIGRMRAPFETRLNAPLARTDALLYRRGNFNGSWDQLICDALLEVQGAQIAFSPGFRWGTALLPGALITRETLMEQLAITYPQTTVTRMTGAAIKATLEDVADNLFNPDPYQQQGGDMVRTGGLSYSCTPGAGMGARIGDLRLKETPIDADRLYTVAGWAPVTEPVPGAPLARPIWDVVEEWLASRPDGRVSARAVNVPRLLGEAGNPGQAGD